MNKPYAAIILTAVMSFSTHAMADVFDGQSVALVGSAKILQNGDLQLTDGTPVQSGAAWLSQSLATDQSFTATFSFSLERFSFSPMADGIALAMQSSGTDAVGAAGGGIGYNGLGAVGSLIQTYTNNRAGLNVTGHTVDTPDAPFALGSVRSLTGNQTVSYNAAKKLLSLSGNFNGDGQIRIIEYSTEIDLAEKFGSHYFLGFTGATGASTADQRITAFSVSTVPEPGVAAMMLLGLGFLLTIAPWRRRALSN